MPGPHPSTLNGDLPLTPDQVRAYMTYHADRNATNAVASIAAGVVTIPSPVWGTTTAGGASPARTMLDAFYDWFARRAVAGFADRPVTIVDLGCGGGARLGTFARAGFRGDYIGIDIARSPKWTADPINGLHPSLIVADLHAFDERTLPPIDILISTTALEHVKDDAGIIRRFTSRLAPGGVQAHFVPAEAALDLYGKHGWRQYSPICLRHLFPDATIYRFGGVFSNELHARAIFEPSLRGRPFMSARHPRLYAIARAAALMLDRITGCARPSMYAAVTPPAPARTSNTIPTAHPTPLERAA